MTSTPSAAPTQPKRPKNDADTNKLLSSSSLSSSSSSSSASFPSSSAQQQAASSSPSFPKIDRNFDVDNYIADYVGVGRIRRLLHIGERCPSVSTRCFRLAIEESRSIQNIALYVESYSRARDVIGESGIGAPVDQKFINNATKAFNDKVQKLEADVLNAKRDAEREPTKNAYMALADYYLERGEYSSALSKYLEAKEYCINKDHLATCVKIIKASIYIGSLSHVKTQVQRAKSLSAELVDEPGIAAQLNAALGLYNLKTGSFRGAAQSFIATSFEINSLTHSFKDILVGRDVAVFGSLCGLASFSRNEIKDSILNNTEFKKLLDLAPIWRQIATNLYQSNYSAVFTALDNIKDELLLDMWLAPHVHTLYRSIRDRALATYFKPYTLVNMNTMAAAFNVDVPTLERQVAALIADNKIQARIDSQHKILHARHADQRTQTFQESMNVSDRYIRDVQGLLMRMSLIQNDFSIKLRDEKGKPTADLERVIIPDDKRP